MLKRLFVLILALALTGLTASCGGGSDDDGNGNIAPAPTPTPTPTPTGQLPITPDNAQDITTQVLNSVTSVLDLTGVADLTGLTLPDLAMAKAQPSDFQAVTVNTVPCDTGLAEVTWDDADDNFEVSTGDTFDALLTACFLDDEDVTLDGGVSLTGVELTGAALLGIPPFSLGATFGFTDLAGTDSEGTAVINGDFDLDIATTDGLVTEASITSDSLTAVEDDESVTLSGFALTETFDLNALSTTIDASGTLQSSELNGSVNFETTQSFVFIGDEDPFTGEMRVADSTSELVMTVLDNVNIQIAVDADGDGTAETTLDLTWIDLDLD